MEQHFFCWDGPCEGRVVTDCPIGAAVGTACAIPWRTVEGEDRYAVYVLLAKPGGDMGLVYERRSYRKPWQAQQRVQQLARVVRTVRQQAAEN
jgi:pyruvoyl-dependent arginine decarboxylase (PvlArgDC)